jgi:CubicO group peptidase (beta-lactamase class C family)
MPDLIEGVADELEATAASFVGQNRLPGAAVGVIHDEGLAWFGGIGFADAAERRAPEPTTLYRVTSITKTFTGTAIMQLRDEGRLHLDDPAVTYLPELRGAASPFGAIETLTIRRMLSHESYPEPVRVAPSRPPHPSALRPLLALHRTAVLDMCRG